jgi:hypothetical protein
VPVRHRPNPTTFMWCLRSVEVAISEGIEGEVHRIGDIRQSKARVKLMRNGAYDKDEATPRQVELAV